MTKYYIHLNNQQIGPLSIEEVREKQISKDTKVWHEGLPEWVNASEIESLSVIFTTPPPLEFVAASTGQTPPPIATSYANYETDIEDPKILGLKKGHFYVAAAMISLFLLYIGFSSYRNHRDVEIQEQVTNAEQNEQLQQQQALLEQQQAQIAEQERREKERLEAEAQKEFRAIRDNLTNELAAANLNLSTAKAKLADVSGFKVLRSQSERERQIAQAQIAVDQWQRETTRLESAIAEVNRKIK